LTEGGAGTTGALHAASALSPEARTPLYTTPFVVLCLVAFAAFASQMMLQPVLPLLVLELDGDSAIAGLVIFAFSVPSVVVRPLFGRLSDRWSRLGVLAIGVGGVALSGIAYLVPLLIVVVLVRIAHGVAWAAFNTGAGSLLADLAPARRRGEAAGVYSLTQGLANVLMPAIGLAMVTGIGVGAPFVFVTLLGVAGLAGVAVIASRTPQQPHASDRAASRGPLLERSALLPMAIDLAWLSAYPIFFVFPPVIAVARGISLEDLWPYYLVAGTSLVLGRVVAARFLDRYTRRTALLAGCALGLAGLAVGTISLGLPGLVVAGALYAAGMSAVGPTVLALTMDRAPFDRVGAAIATQTLGGQLGIGVGSVLVGVALNALPVGASFILLLIVMAALTVGVYRLVAPVAPMTVPPVG
jgi:MFS family permease